MTFRLARTSYSRLRNTTISAILTVAVISYSLHYLGQNAGQVEERRLKFAPQSHFVTARLETRVSGEPTNDLEDASRAVTKGSEDSSGGVTKGSEDSSGGVTNGNEDASGGLTNEYEDASSGTGNGSEDALYASDRWSGPGTTNGSDATSDGGTSRPLNHMPQTRYSYPLVLNNPDTCKDQDVFLVIIVTTLHENHRRRYEIRHTWGNESNVQDTVIKVLFAVGRTPDIVTQHALKLENDAHNDIIQHDFVDSYRNLTTKTVMSLKWVAEYCPNARYMMKVDDDTFVGIFNLVKHLRELDAKNIAKLVLGFVYSGRKPQRHPVNVVQQKWYVSEEEYERDTFPKYPCGFAYVISNDMLRPLYDVSLNLKYLFLEDVHIGLAMEKLGIEPVHNSGFYPEYPWEGPCQVLASHWVKKPGVMTKLWMKTSMC